MAHPLIVIIDIFTDYERRVLGIDLLHLDKSFVIAV
jgi:hypothetical protein